MPFSNGQLVQASDLNNLDVATIVTSGDVTVGDDLAVTGDTAITGTLTVGGSSIGTNRDTVCGRLTLTSGTPVTTGDVSAAGTLYWALYNGDQIALYTGTSWTLVSIAQLSIAVPAAANQVYDAFVDYNAGTPALTLTAWSSDTARATALTTQDGVLVLTGTLGKRYVGTVRTITASQLNDTFAFRHVWNYYNRMPRLLRVIDTANSWTYDSTTYQQANASTANQLDIVVGVAEEAIEVNVLAHASHSASAQASVSIGMDGIVPATGVIGMRSSIGTGVPFDMRAALKTYPAIGRHYFTWIESGGGATTTWYGDNNTPTLLQSGIHGMVRG